MLLRARLHYNALFNLSITTANLWWKSHITDSLTMISWTDNLFLPEYLRSCIVCLSLVVVVSAFRCQHPERCGRCWCAGWLWQVQGAVHFLPRGIKSSIFRLCYCIPYRLQVDVMWNHTDGTFRQFNASITLYILGPVFGSELQFQTCVKVVAKIIVNNFYRDLSLSYS